MSPDDKPSLENAGWKVANTADLLELTPEEAAYIELKLKLAAHLRQLRQEQSLTQTELAQRLQSSQSRVAKMEAGDPSVSLDLLVRSLLVMGSTKNDLAELIITTDMPLAA